MLITNQHANLKKLAFFDSLAYTTEYSSKSGKAKTLLTLPVVMALQGTACMPFSTNTLLYNAFS